jgi:hypothetical protein
VLRMQIHISWGGRIRIRIKLKGFKSHNRILLGICRGGSTCRCEGSPRSHRGSLWNHGELII